MKIFSTTSDFDYSWEEVSTANWRKYSPWNQKTPHVVAVDTVSRNVDQATGILRTERLITCRQPAPKWLSPFLGGQDTSFVFETSYIDRAAKKVTMCSTNLTWSDLLSVEETVQYTPLASQPDSKTRFEQHARITAFCGGWQKVKNSIEQFTVDRFKQNADRGREGFETVLQMSRKAFFQERERQRLRESTLQ